MEDDKLLYQEFLQGNQESFEKIMDKYAEKIIYFIYKYVKKFDIAEDLAQDVFVYILANKENYKFEHSLKSYLFMIGKCRALNYLKKEKRIIHLDNENIYYEEKMLIDIEEVVFSNMQGKEVKKAIGKLKPEQEKIIYLADIEGLKYDEISQILGKNIGQVKSLIYRARKNLKEIIEKEELKYV